MRLKGHTGVLFDSRFIKRKGMDGISILTVSDDRSIRCWDLNLDGGTYNQSLELYGHRSRVWTARQCQGSDGIPLIASVSEDSTCKIWAMN